MIYQGLIYMVLGMAAVFAFLLVLVVALRITSRIVAYLDKRCPLQSAPGSVSHFPDLAVEEGEAIAAALGAVLNHDPSLLQAIPIGLPGGLAAISPSLEANPHGPDGGTAAKVQHRGVNPWALSGRQTSMKMRALLQRGVLRR